jgi:hypothetical protein
MPTRLTRMSASFGRSAALSLGLCPLKSRWLIEGQNSYAIAAHYGIASRGMCGASGLHVGELPAPLLVRNVALKAILLLLVAPAPRWSSP